MNIYKTKVKKMSVALFKNYSGKGKIIIDLELITNEPLHIGASEKSVKVNESDLFCVKRNNGNPYIPGSSMRGMLRAYLLRICDILTDKSLLSTLGLADINITHYPKNEEYVCDLHDIFKKMKKGSPISLEQIAIDEKMICDICLLFGAKGYGSPLKITDFEAAGNVELVHRNHIAIDIESDTTQRGALFFVESVAEGSVFKGKLIFEKKDHTRQKQVIKLLEIIIHYLKNQEIYLGGLKSRGYGLVKVTKIEVQDYSIKDEILGIKPTPTQIL